MPHTVRIRYLAFIINKRSCGTQHNGLPTKIGTGQILEKLSIFMIILPIWLSWLSMDTPMKLWVL